METVTDFISLSSKITVDADCSHENNRCLLFGRKAMTNLDNIFKSKDITLPTKVHIVKAMVFWVVEYGMCDWTIKKAEHWRTDALNCGVGEDSWESPVDCKEKENQLILKEINPENALEGVLLKLKLQYFGHLMWRPNSLEKTLMLWKIEGRREGDDRGWDGWMALLIQWT